MTGEHPSQQLVAHYAGPAHLSGHQVQGPADPPAAFPVSNNWPVSYHSFLAGATGQWNPWKYAEHKANHIIIAIAVYNLVPSAVGSPLVAVR